MKKEITMTQNYAIAFDGINVVSFVKGETLTLGDERAALLIERGVAKAKPKNKPSPVEENKSESPVEEVKAAKKPRKTTKKKASK